jgi:hypothetical protein
MLKAVFTLVILAVFAMQKAPAQYRFDENPLKQKLNKGLQALNEGEFMFTAYGSYPNFMRYRAQISLLNGDAKSATTGGIAPIGFQFEYMLSNLFGFTIDGIFNSYNARWIHEYSDFDPFTGTNVNVVSNNSVTQTRYRLLFGLNYHYNEVENEKFDFYAGLAIGMNRRNLSVSVDHFWKDRFWDFTINYPLATRACLGIRFFATKQLGLNFELGAGGPVLRYGLTYRILNHPKEKESNMNKF